MGKILSWVLLIAAVYAGMRFIAVLQRKSRLRAAQREQDRGANGSDAAASAEISEPMLRCARCGVHAPASEMLRARGRFFCGVDHRDADA